MPSTILVPLDGSSLAEAAVPYAVALARSTAGRLVLMRAVHPVAPEKQVLEIEQAERYLAEVSARVAKTVSVETALPYAPVTTAIQWEIDIRRVDCIVMATHGRTGLPHLVFGSVAEDIIKFSPVPVLLVRSHAASAPPPDFDGGPLMVPLDGSRFAEAALVAAMDLAPRTARLVLTRVVNPREGPVIDNHGRVHAYPAQREQAIETDAADYLHRLATDLQSRYPGIGIDIDVRDGAAAAGIVAAEQQYRPTLTVMATHGRTGVPRLVLGSVAGEVLRLGTTPLLLVRPPASTGGHHPLRESDIHSERAVPMR